MTQEAHLEETGAGLAPAGDGWFVLNVADAAWRTHDHFGASARFESADRPFPEVAVNVRALEPGQPNALYHAEDVQEDFLVIAGECVLLVEDEERPLRPWDFVHCPPGTSHVFVATGERPCVIVMLGSRCHEAAVVYPVSETASRHRAGVEQETTKPAEAYAGFERPTAERPACWDELPWS